MMTMALIKEDIGRIIVMPMDSHFPHKDGVAIFLVGFDKRHVSVVSGDRQFDTWLPIFGQRKFIRWTLERV